MSNPFFDSFFGGGAVGPSKGLDRILALPRRVSKPEEDRGLAEDLTEVLKTDAGTMNLRAVQARALHDIDLCGGAFCPIPVGHGKSLLSFLAPYVLDAKRPLLLLPAGLRKKTEDDMGMGPTGYGPHWLIPKNIPLCSYELLGRPQGCEWLTTYKPDLIMADEAHRLKNPESAVTLRVARYMEAFPATRFIALSGTIMDRSLLEFAHILRWCLKENAPIPLDDNELGEWAAALDDKVEEMRRYRPGALLRLAEGLPAIEGEDDLARARRGFRHRLVETPGVIAVSGEGEPVHASLKIRPVFYAPLAEEDDHMEEHFARLRTELKMSDDWDLGGPMEVWAHAREMALDLSYHWDPRPPDEWRKPRSAWFKFVRQTLAKSRAHGGTLDSESQVTDLVDNEPSMFPQGAKLLAAWRAVAKTFTPNVVGVWHGDRALKAAAKWMKQRPGIVWTEHTIFAEALSEMTGVKYYGRRGLAPDGEFIDHADARKCVIASIDANKEGRNLQKKWSRNLFISMPTLPGILEQAIGRTHRTGQTADEVEVDFFIGCLEHVNGWRRAYEGAKAVHATTGAEQKLLLADLDDLWPTEEQIATWTGARWVPPPPKDFVIPEIEDE